MRPALVLALVLFPLAARADAAGDLKRWVKQGLIEDVRENPNTGEIADILVTPKFCKLAEQKQAQIVGAVCRLASQKTDAQECTVQRGEALLGHVDLDADAGPGVRWEDWYLLELRRRAFAR